MENIIYENALIKVKVEPFEILWLIIFAKENVKEFSQCSKELQLEILNALNVIECEMLDYFNPDKINIASFGNYLPQVHFHIQARFKDDSFFPESIWGKKQRSGKVILKDKDIFYKNIKNKLDIGGNKYE